MATSALRPDPKAALNILISGAGVCGPAFALMLLRSNPSHNITIVERSPSLRTGGQQLDLKNQGIPIIKKLGLLDAVRAYGVKETGMEIVNKHGKSLMKFGIATAGEKQTVLAGLTTEFEFMRGDLVKMFVEETKKVREQVEAAGTTSGSLTYMFNTSITTLTPSSPPQPSGVNVTFSTDPTTSTHYDLVVAADGQGSRTRKLAFGASTSASAFKSLNIHAAFYNIPRQPSETSLARVYVGENRRMYFTRSSERPDTQIYHFLMNASAQESEHMRETYKRPLAEQKEAWTELFAGAGWETPRFLTGLQKVQDFYACEIAQVKMPEQQLHTNRVVLLGDAGYCPSVMTGMGTTLSLIGAYILAGELARNGRNVDAALDAYQQIMRQPVEECQKLLPGVDGGLFPTSKWGIWVMNTVLWVAACLKVDKVFGWVAGLLPEGKGGWEIPEYEELGLNR